jgi:hypothetical protein
MEIILEVFLKKVNTETYCTTNSFDNQKRFECFFEKGFWDAWNQLFIIGIQQTLQKKIGGIYTVGWNYHRKRPNTVGKRSTVGIIFCPSPQFFHNFVSFHPILMFLTILESGDKTKNIEDEFKTHRLSHKALARQFLFIFRYEKQFWIHKANLNYNLAL